MKKSKIAGLGVTFKRWNDITGEFESVPEVEPVDMRIHAYSRFVKISVPSLKLMFQTCEPNYIRMVCHGRCCESKAGLMVTVHSTEKERIEKLGAVVKDNFIEDTNKTKVCPFKKEHMCSIHELKPFGCKASPFTLNRNGTLIVRNRYKLLCCYKTAEAVPAYEAHRWSLVQIFGEEETVRIIQDIKRGKKDDVWGKMPEYIYRMLVDNDNYKHPERIAEKGNSLNLI